MVFDISVSAQCMLFLRAMLLGAALMLLYDCFRIARIAFPSPAWVVMIQDIVYFAVFALVSFLFFVSQSYGEVRFFALTGELLGLILCYFTLSSVIIASSQTVISVIKKIILLFERLILSPIYKVIYAISRKIIKFVNFLGNLAKKSCNKANYSLKRRRVLLYNLIGSCGEGHEKKKDVNKRAGKKEKKRQGEKKLRQ